MSCFVVSSIDTEFHESLFYHPRNVSHFLWLYETSEFLHCNRALAKRMENKYRLYQNGTKYNTIVEPILHVIHTLDRLEKRYLLAGGALLGMIVLHLVRF